MSVFTLTYSRALAIYPNDTTDIPFPNMVLSGTVTSITPSSRLIDSTKDFIAIGIKVGDIIFSSGSFIYAYVTAVYQNYLELSNNAFMGVGDAYQIYQGENNGCYIYVGDTTGGADLEVETIGGDIVIFLGVQQGQVLPVQVKKVFSSSSAQRLIALW